MDSTEPATNRCPRCGAELPPDAADKPCTRCALASALAAASNSDTDLDATPELGFFDIPAPGEKVAYFGDYELLNQIGEGGMGVVYRARQCSLKRLVALKMLLGGRHATEEYKRRFRQEAEAAAQLRHPNIVPLFEVGEYQGQPYLTMEFVGGEDDGPAPTLAQMVKDRPLPPERAAQYVRTVAEAVHSAHEQGIIHRDLKPSNILVGTDGRPRVTDFGLAKQIGVSPDLTFSGQVLGTPGYWPPEQAAGKLSEVGRASDVYALGAVLYCLLTGKPPFHAATLAETLQQVLHQEPVSPRSLNASVPHDLETICLKCLQKDTARRYISAQSLADDLTRFADGNPILARPIGLFERAVKWYRREPRIAWLLTTAIGAVLAGGIVSTWQAVIARTANTQAQTQAVKSAEVSSFLKQMLAAVGPSVAKGQDTTMLNEILDQAAKRLSHDLTNQIEVQVELRNTIGGVYIELGQYGSAEDLLTTAVVLTTNRLGRDDPLLGASLVNLATVKVLQGDLPKAETLYRQALGVLRSSLGARGPEANIAAQNLVRVLNEVGKLDEAEALRRVLLQDLPLGTADTQKLEAVALHNSAVLLRTKGNTRQAEAQQRKALHTLTNISGIEHPDVATALFDLAVFVRDNGDLAEAERLHRQALAIQVRVLGPDHPAVGTSLNSLAIVLRERGMFPEAEATHKQALQILRRRLGDDNPALVAAMNNQALNSLQREDLADAETKQREVLGNVARLFGTNHSNFAIALNNLASTLAEKGSVEEAERFHRQALQILKSTFADPHPHVAASLNNLALLLQTQGRFKEARGLQEEAIAIQKRLWSVPHPSMATSLNNLANILKEQGDLPEAERLQRDAVETRKKVLPPDHPEIAHASMNLALILDRMGRVEEAESLLRSAIQMLKRSSGPEDINAIRGLGHLGRILNRSNTVPQAELVFREALAASQKVWSNVPKKWESSVENLLDTLLTQGRASDAAQVLEGLMSPADEAKPEFAGMVRLRGLMRARQGEWGAATADLTQAVRVDPSRILDTYQLATLALQGHDLDGWRRWCVVLLETPSTNREPSKAARIAQCCLLRPPGSEHGASLDALTKRSLDVSAEARVPPDGQLAMSLLELRRGRFANALHWIGKLSSDSAPAIRNVQAVIIRSLAEHGLGHHEAAQKAIEEAQASIGALLPRDGGDWGTNWHEVLIARLLLSEATGTVTAPAISTKAKSVTPDPPQ